jgi:agmatinase
VDKRRDLPWIPRNFLSLAEEQCNIDEAKVILIPIPYDSTVSFRSGTRDGPAAIIDASYGLEDYDAELDLDVSTLGIYTSPALESHMAGPEQMVKRIKEAVKTYMQDGNIVGVIGGEHSISIGAVQAHREVYPDISVLYLDAHPDLRNEYMDTAWGHASGGRRIHDICPLVLVGVRSLCQEEHDYIRAQAVPTFFWPPESSDDSWIPQIVRLLSPSVYVSVDLDALDPSFMSAVGTPEPGGMNWHQVTSLLRAVSESRRIIGFDVTELSPGEGPRACSYIAAKLVLKLLAYSSTSH